MIKESCDSLSRRDRAWLQIACKLAMVSQERTKHGCLIVRGGAVQAMGVNTYRNQSGIVAAVEALSTHAEINALKRAKRLDGAVIYIARVNTAGQPRQSRPCPDCLKALKEAGCKRIVYTVNGQEDL